MLPGLYWGAAEQCRSVWVMQRWALYHSQEMWVSDLEAAACGHRLFCMCGAPSVFSLSQAEILWRHVLGQGLSLQGFNTTLAEAHAVKNAVLIVRTWVAFQEHVERSALQWFPPLPSPWRVLLSWWSCKTTLNAQGLKLAQLEWVLAVMLELSEGLCCTQRTIAELYCKYAMMAGTTKIEMKTHDNSSGSLAMVSWWCISSLGFDWSYHKGVTEKWLLEQQITPEGTVKKSLKKACKIKMVLFFCVSLRWFFPFSNLRILSFYCTFLENFV